MRAAAVKLERTTLRTSRLLDFCSRKELIAQTGHQPDAWPLVVLKELVDNALDACEEAEVAPQITIRVGDDGITVTDNGPGIPAETITDVLAEEGERDYANYERWCREQGRGGEQ